MAVMSASPILWWAFGERDRFTIRG
jgi:hypothetical protein